jgi:lipopolysaccharide export system permease protein
VIKRKIFFQYIFKELLSPFVLGVLIFTFILLMNKILKLMDMVINKGIGIGEVGTLILYLLPSLLVLTVPMSILLAILIVLGKLSADSEIIAMKSSGISLFQMLPPFAAFCVIGFVLTNILTLNLLPRGNQALRNRLIDLAQTHALANLEERVFSDIIDDMVIYIDRFDTEQQMINGILISDRRDPQTPILMVGENAVILSEPENKSLLIRLFNGSLHRQERGSGSYQYAVFGTYEMSIPLKGLDEKKAKIKNRERSLSALLKGSADSKTSPRDSIRMKVEIHQRFAFPFACLVFGLLGVPLGIYWRRGGRAYGFMLSIVIVFLYYLFLSIGESLAKSRVLLPSLGMWMPNVVLGALGIYLFRKAAREAEIPLLQVAAAYILSAVNRIKARAGKKKGVPAA